MRRRNDLGPVQKALISWAILAFALCPASPALAADGIGTTTSGSIVITEAISHPASAYQVFNGNVEADGSISDIIWGSGVKSGALVDALSTVSGFEGVTSAREVAQKLNIIEYSNGAWRVRSEISTGTVNGGTETGLAKKFAEIVSRHIDPTNAYRFDDTTSPKAQGLDDGWYVIVSDGGDLAENAALLFPSLITVGADEVRVTPKESSPTFKKEVKDDAVGAEWGSYADFEIGQTFQQRLVATIGDSDLNYYDSYYLCFTDEIPEGLDLDESSIQVQVGNSILTDGYQKSYQGKKLTIGLEYAKGQLAPETEIVVSYSTKLNDKAAIGSAGNINKAQLTYSADPRVTESGKQPIRGITPEDTTTAYTYELKLTKYDAADGEKTLEGAKFLLKNSKEQFAVLEAADGSIDRATNNNEGESSVMVTRWVDTEAQASFVTTNEDGEARIIGLDSEDEYALKEVVAPDGYNLNSGEIPFVISANTAAETALTSLFIAVSNKEPQLGNASTGLVSMNATNVKAPILPTTGLGGIAASVVLGSGMVAAGAVVLAVQTSRKRKG